MNMINSITLLCLGLFLASNALADEMSVQSSDTTPATTVTTTTTTTGSADTTTPATSVTTTTPTNSNNMTATPPTTSTTTIQTTTPAQMTVTPTQTTNQAPTTTTDMANSAMVDAKIKSNAETAISSDNSLAGTNISISIDNGIVTLSGTVNNQTQADTAARIVRGLAGVRDIKSSITVSTPNTSTGTNSSTSTTLSY